MIDNLCKLGCRLNKTILQKGGAVSGRLLIQVAWHLLSVYKMPLYCVSDSKIFRHLVQLCESQEFFEAALSVDDIICTRMLGSSVQDRLLQPLDVVVGNSFRICQFLGNSTRYRDLKSMGQRAALCIW